MAKKATNTQASSNREENQTGNDNGNHIKQQRSTKPLAERALNIEEMRLENLAMAGLSDEQIAATLKVPLNRLREDYGEQIQQARLRGVGVLWRKTFEIAVVQGNEKMLMFLVDKRDPLEADPQVREMRSLEIRERRLRVEQLESSREQEINALRESAGLARFDGMSAVELHGELARMLLENLLWTMEVVRRRVVLQAFLQPDSSLQEDVEFQFQLRIFRMLTPQQQEQLLCQHDIKKVPTAVQG